MEPKEWLASLKTGDTVVETYSYGSRMRLAKVEKITPRFVVLSGKRNFRREDGRASGGELLEPTPERRRTIALANMRGYLGSVKWRDVPDDVVERVARMVAGS